MNAISGTILILCGTSMILIGFKIINTFKGVDSEYVETWYKKWGLLLKIGGIFTFLAGILNFLRI